MAYKNPEWYSNVDGIVIYEKDLMIWKIESLSHMILNEF